MRNFTTSPSDHSKSIIEYELFWIMLWPALYFFLYLFQSRIARQLRQAYRNHFINARYEQTLNLITQEQSLYQDLAAQDNRTTNIPFYTSNLSTSQIEQFVARLGEDEQTARRITLNIKFMHFIQPSPYIKLPKLHGILIDDYSIQYLLDAVVEKCVLKVNSNVSSQLELLCRLIQEVNNANKYTDARIHCYYIILQRMTTKGLVEDLFTSIINFIYPHPIKYIGEILANMFGKHNVGKLEAAKVEHNKNFQTFLTGYSLSMQNNNKLNDSPNKDSEPDITQPYCKPKNI